MNASPAMSFVRRAMVVVFCCIVFVCASPDAGVGGSSTIGRSPVRAGIRNAAAARETTLFAFPGGPGGLQPTGNLFISSYGHFFGTTVLGGNHGCSASCGVVYDLIPHGSTFAETVVYNLGGEERPGTSDGEFLFDRYSLYDTGGQGGVDHNGAVYRLYYENGGYHEKTIYSFSGPDGSRPNGGLISDVNGTLYGVTEFNGTATTGRASGTVFALSGAGTGTWSATVLYTFQGAPDGALPVGSLVADASGDLYGETMAGGLVNNACGSSGCGTIFELTPTASGYSERLIYEFTGGADGTTLTGTLSLDAAGDIFGMASQRGTGCTTGFVPGCGTAFELSPAAGGFTERTIYAFKGGNDGSYPVGGLVADTSGNFYGATQEGGGATAAGLGTVFELSPSGSKYVETVLHKFEGADGSNPSGTPILSSTGALFGATEAGGSCTTSQYGCGVIYEVVP